MPMYLGVTQQHSDYFLVRFFLTALLLPRETHALNDYGAGLFLDVEDDHYDWQSAGLRGTNIRCAQVDQSHVKRPSQTETSKQLSKLRNHMIELQLDAYIIPDNDEFMMKQRDPMYNRLRFITGFTGENALAIVLLNEAILWTRPSQFAQAQTEIDCNWAIRTSNNLLEPIIPWLIATFTKEAMSSASILGQRNKTYFIGANDKLIQYSLWNHWSEMLESDNAVYGSTYQLIAVNESLVDKVWDTVVTRTNIRKGNIFPFESYTQDLTREGKIIFVSEKMVSKGTKVDAMIVTELAEIAWLMNFRGSDYKYTNLFQSYLVIDQMQNRTTLFVATIQLAADAAKQFQQQPLDAECASKDSKICLKLKMNDLIEFEKIVSLDKAKWKSVWLTPTVSYAIYQLVKSNTIIWRQSPVEQAMLTVNSTILQGMRKTNVREGIFFMNAVQELQKEMQSKSFTEKDVVDWLNGRRKETLSIPTIVAAGPNTADPFYAPVIDDKASSNRVITMNELIIIETGIHDVDGSSDVVRTIHFGEPSFQEKMIYTRALMAIIEAGRLVMPEDSTDHDIDTIIRQQVYEGGFDYPHVTGHGMDPLLRAIKNPPQVRLRRPDLFKATRLQEGMIFVIEPGCYYEGEFGVRLGNIFRVIEDYHEVEIPDERKIKFYTLDSLTVIPFETKLIDWQILTEEQRKWIFWYNMRIGRLILEKLREDGVAKTDEMPAWLLERTTLKCSRASHLRISSILVIIVLLLSTVKYLGTHSTILVY